jgi:DNA-binding NarL/FixJ family response regulator
MVKRVLLIDDDPLFIRRLKDALGDSVNLQVVSIADDAISACSEWQPDLVLLDVLIAPGDSFSILDDISRAERAGQFSVLCLSRGAGSTTRLQSFGNAVFGILKREADREALATTVNQALEHPKHVAA